MRSPLMLIIALLPLARSIALPAAVSRAVWASHHLFERPLQSAVLEDLANVKVPAEEDREILAFAARPKVPPGGALPVLLVLHEFWGLSGSIVDKAQGLADELGCLCIAPDCFRGETTDFVPKAIWLALSTPQQRVNADLAAVLRWAASQDGVAENFPVGVLGFCFGGGKAIGFTTTMRPDAATVVFYGEPVLKVEALAALSAPVCGIYGAEDPQPTTNRAAAARFRSALAEAGVEHDVTCYEGVGHAFWKDMGQIERRETPQIAAWRQSTTFLRTFFDG